jgi:PAS domain S-box-containing protein
LRYGVALAFALAAVAASFLLPKFPPEDRYFLFVVAVFAGSAYAGFGPGIAATLALAVADNYLFLAPLYSLQISHPESFERLVLFILEGIAISGVGYLVPRSPPQRSQTMLVRYGLPLCAATGLVAIKFFFLNLVSRQFPFTLCYAILVATTWNGGLAPAALVTLVSGAAAYLLFIPPPAGSLADQRVIVFVLESALLTLLVGRFRELILSTTSSFRRLFLDCPAGVIVLGSDYRILKANPAFCRMLSHAGDLEGADFPALLHPRSRDWMLGALRARESAAEETISEHAFKFQEGDVAITTEMRATTIDLPESDEKGWLLIVQDVTEREKSEHFLVETESRLRQAEKLEALGLLASSIAHEFNNSLAVILGYSEQLIQKRANDDLVRLNAQEISRASQRASEFSKQLLAYSRPKSRRLEPVSPNVVIRDFSLFVSRLLGDRAELVTNLERDIPLVTADPVQIEQILVNLVANARDAMPNGGTLIVRTKRTCILEPVQAIGSVIGPGEYVTLSVSDTGKGIDPTTLSHIFEPFFTTKAEGRGTGLGLATVARTVKALNGHIAVKSVVGQGSEFTIYLMEAQSLAETRAPVTPALEKIDARETLLIAEDDDSLRRLMVEILGTWGYRVLDAKDGDQAIAVANGVRLDLLITDLRLPGMSGVEIARNLLEIQPGVGVLYITGTPDAIEDESCHPLLVKPFTLEQLTSLVREVLDARHGAARS